MTVSPTIPPHAVSLWLEGDYIHMSLPAIGKLTSHRLTFKNDPQGVAQAMYIVKNRTMESKLGNDGDLTQAQVERKLKMKAGVVTGNLPPVKRADSFSPTLRAGAREVMRRLGL